MAVADLTIAITAAALAAAALIFAVVQTVSALSQFLASSNRCGRRITGAFDLRAGMWFSPNTMTVNPRYRMPVLTMSALRTRVPMMEAARNYPTDFRPGRNFNTHLNCYVDERRSRISSSPGGPKKQQTLDKTLTFIHYVTAIFWTPIGFILTSAVWALCCPCCVCMTISVGPKELCKEDVIEERNEMACCGTDCCTSKELVLCSLKPLYEPFVGATHYKNPNNATNQQNTKVDLSIAESQTPGLEAGCWVQFLTSHQRVWWGSADLRWEWRLASLIPADVYGASMETTVADVELLAVLSGMSVNPGVGILAASLCGEQITFSQHGSLGRMAYYRSTRENTKSAITLEVPKASSGWLYHCIEACRNGKANPFSLNERYSEAKIDGNPAPANLPAVVAHLARQRTEFDAQLPYSCGSAMWMFACKTFSDALQDMGTIAPGSWDHDPVTVIWGPLGEGINSCSCNRCCDEWTESLVRRRQRQHQQQMCPDRHRRKSHSSLYCRHCINLKTSPRIDLISTDNLNMQWPALKCNTYSSPNNGQTDEVWVVGSEELWKSSKATGLTSIAGAVVDIDIATLCNSHCAPQSCQCGPIARLTNFTVDEHDENKVLGVVSINTGWLGQLSSEVLTQAAESLLMRDYPASSDFVATVAIVMAYTEYLLLKVRRKIGATNIWNAAPSPALTDFSPLMFGA